MKKDLKLRTINLTFPTETFDKLKRMKLKEALDIEQNLSWEGFFSIMCDVKL